MNRMKNQEAGKNFNIHIVEDHNEVLHDIYKEIGSKRLNFSNLVLIHFDSHPDLGIPSNLKADSVFEKDTLLSSLSIENWILPAVYAGHIEKIVWIKPKWANQIDVGKYELVIGKEQETGLIRCSCRESYFISDLLYSSEESLTNKRNFILYICDFDSILDDNDQTLDGIFKDLEKTSCQTILDIDLDFFSTKDPFKEMFARSEEFDLFKSIYNLPFNLSSKDLDFDEKYTKYKEDKKAKISKISDFLGRIKESSNNEKEVDESDLILFENIKKLVEITRKNKADLEILHDYGCGIDEFSIPHNISTDDELSDLFTRFKTFLEKYFSKIIPSIVTIARSSLDDYCPPDQVEHIQEHVLNSIRKHFDNKTIKSVCMNY